MATVTLKGNPFNLPGTVPTVGASAPDFNLTRADQDVIDVRVTSGVRVTDIALLDLLSVFVGDVQNSQCSFAADLERSLGRANRGPRCSFVDGLLNQIF